MASFVPHAVSHLIKTRLVQYNQFVGACLCQERRDAQRRCLLWIFHLNRIRSFPAPVKYTHKWILFRFCVAIASAKTRFQKKKSTAPPDIVWHLHFSSSRPECSLEHTLQYMMLQYSDSWPLIDSTHINSQTSTLAHSHLLLLDHWCK